MERDAHLFDLCRGYLDAQAALMSKRNPQERDCPQRPAITISRQAGAGAVTIAGMVAEQLQADTSENWAVFDRNLVEKVIDDHELPKRLNRFLPEDIQSGIASAVEEFFGLHPSVWTMVEHTTETMLRLAKMGNAILVGRGGAIIAGSLSHAVHVRLVGPLDTRVNHCREFYHLSRAEAEKLVHERDLARTRYVHRYFHARIDDPLHYHLTINTGRVGFKTAAQLIVDCVKGLEVSRLGLVEAHS
jgi:cytidylate kinase